MAYYRRYRRRYTRRPRRSRRHKSFRRFGRRAGSVAYKALRTAQTVRSLMNVEFGHLDTSRSLTPDTSGAVYLLNGISQGDGNSNRHGKQVKMVNWNTIIRAVKHASETTGTFFRIIIFKKWTQDNTASTVSDILDGVDILAHYNLDEIKNHKILFDRTYTLNSNIPERYIRINLRNLGKVIYSIGNTGNSVTDIEHNGLHMIVISDHATNTPSLSCKERLRWIDN